MLNQLALPVLAALPMAEPAPLPAPAPVAINIAAARAEPPASTAAASDPAKTAAAAKGDQPIPEQAKKFGDPGFWTINFGAGVADDFDGATDVAGTLGFSTFIASNLEFNCDLSGWFFHQDGPDTGGISSSFAFRYHFFFGEENKITRDWSLFAEAGIGLLGAFNEVPDGGTNFNFMPRLGGGATFRLTDSGTRLLIGARWHHISNARISGDSDNPSRDGVMIHAAIMFPF